AGVRQLVEGVPDRDGIERAARLELVESTVVHGEAERSRERVAARVDIEALELPPRVASSTEERAHVAADLEPRAATLDGLRQSPSLRAIGTSLRLVQSA